MAVCYPMHSRSRKRALAVGGAGMQTLSVVVVIIIFIFFFSLKYKFLSPFSSLKNKYRMMKNFPVFLVNLQVFL